MTSRRWTPIRRALEADRKLLVARLHAPADEPGNGRDDGDRAIASLRQEETMTTRSRARERLDAIERALARLDEGTFGRCAACEGEIAYARLVTLLVVETCIRCAEQQEADAQRVAAPDRRPGPWPVDEEREC